MAAEKILVTGASGYVAGHVIKLLQEAGHVVRGTVRSVKNADKVQHLQKLYPNAAHPLELVEADLLKPESWEQAVRGMKYVIHVASPFPLASPKNEDEVIQPAVDGTLNVLKACAKAGSVKRVVLTSSCAAVDWQGEESHDKPRDESYWSDPSRQVPYCKSKTLAERAAWDFVKTLPDGQKFELAVINPSFVIGPPLQGSSCTSVEVIQRFLNGEMAEIPLTCLPVIDVRDTALAHVRAMTSSEAAGHRHIASNTNVWFSEIAALLNAVFGPQGYSVPTKAAADPPKAAVRLYDNTRLRRVLGVEPRDMRDSLVEMAYALIDAGFIKKSPQHRGPGGPQERDMYMKLQLA